jgi:hypothetical protein
MARHSIEAGYERGNFWRIAQFVEVGQPVVYNKRWKHRSKIRENTVMGDFEDVTGDVDQHNEIELRAERIGKRFLAMSREDFL